MTNTSTETTTTKSLAPWVGMFALYRGSDPFYSMAAAGDREALNQWLASVGKRHGDIQHHANGGCWVCGQLNYAHSVVAARFNEADSTDLVPIEIIEVGHICAGELGMGSMERKYERKAKRARIESHAEDFITHNNLTEVRDLAQAGELGDWGTETARDILDYLRRKGEISEPQVKLLKKIHKSHLDYLERKAQPEIEPTPAPTGKVTVTGKVLTIKEQPGFSYGSIDWKMLVLDDAGYKTWGTIPKALKRPFWENEDGTYALKGKRITFSATVEPSQDDECFSFYKRPTKAELLD